MNRNIKRYSYEFRGAPKDLLINSPRYEKIVHCFFSFYINIRLQFKK